MSRIKSKILLSLFTLVALCLSLGLSGCFQNDGYIGVYFGSWVIEKIEIDGEKDEAYNGHMMISFQSSMFELAEAGGGYAIQGIWKETGDELMLHGAEETARQWDSAGNAIFPNPVGMGRGDNDDLIVRLHIEKKTSKRMVWTRTAPDGRHWRYTLRHLL